MSLRLLRAHLKLALHFLTSSVGLPFNKKQSKVRKSSFVRFDGKYDNLVSKEPLND